MARKRIYTEVSPNVMDVDVDRIRTVALTREEYLKLGGMAVSPNKRGIPQEEFPVEPYDNYGQRGAVYPDELFDNPEQ